MIVAVGTLGGMCETGATVSWANFDDLPPAVYLETRHELDGVSLRVNDSGQLRALLTLTPDEAYRLAHFLGEAISACKLEEARR